jgi:hypothetical protein
VKELKGGRKVIVDANGNEMMEATDENKAYRVIDNAFAQRMNARASVAESNPVWNWTRNVVAFPTAVLGITPQISQRGDHANIFSNLSPVEKHHL